MNIRFTSEITYDLFKKLSFLDDFSELISQSLFFKNPETIYVCLNSADPEIGSGRDFETGLVIFKKYIRSKRTLEFSYKLNHKQMTEAQTREQVLAIILEGFKKTSNEIKSLNIRDFDVDEFYSVIASTIEDFVKNKYPKERFNVTHVEEKKELPKKTKMKEVVFWEIIEQSKEERKDFEHQAEIIIDKLSNLSEKEIVGYEFTFREILAKSCNYKILAAVKIIEGYVNDDSFLYFRCRLLAEGKDFYFKAAENPDYMADKSIQDFNGELLLSIADKAFIKKFGENTDKELPREAALSYMNYDEVEELTGVRWEEKELPQKYPRLWKKYKTVV